MFRKTFSFSINSFMIKQIQLSLFTFTFYKLFLRHVIHSQLRITFSHTLINFIVYFGQFSFMNSLCTLSNVFFINFVIHRILIKVFSQICYKALRLIDRQSINMIHLNMNISLFWLYYSIVFFFKFPLKNYFFHFFSKITKK